jgi:hypothetical protein
MEVTEAEIQRRQELVANQYDGILPYCEVFYIFSIHYSADRAIQAFRRFERSYKENEDAISVTSAIHEALGHTAALSRFFWPSRDKGVAKARAKRLRKAFDLDDSSPLRDRRLRDALEHFDERLDQFLLLNDTGHFFPAPVVDDHLLADEPTAKLFKLVDAEHGIFVILGEKYQFVPLINDVRRILSVTQPMAEHGRLSSSHN